LKQRDEVYKKAKENNPQRWSKSTRNWNSHNHVVLNPVKEDELKRSYQQKKEMASS